MKIRSFLLKNKSLKQVFVKNTIWLFGSTIITHTLTIVLGILIARFFGAANYGLLGFAISFTGLFAIFSELGLHFIIIRELSQNQEAKNEIGALLWLKLFLGFFTFLIITACSFFLEDASVKPLVIIFAAVTCLNSIVLFFTVIFRALQRMEYVALIEIIQSIIIFIGGLLVIFLHPLITLVAFAYLLSAFFSFFTVIVIAKHLSVLPRPVLDIKIIKKYLFLSWPLALSTVFTIVYVQIDIVMMGFLKMMTEVGWYQAAYKIINIVVIPGNIIRTVFYPAISFAYKQKKESFQKIIGTFFDILTFFALPVVVGGFLLSHDIIFFIYGNEFLSSILAFKILIFSIIPILFSMFVDSVLIAACRQKIIICATGITALINIILNLLLIPRYSLYGAAIATVTSYAFYFLFGFIILRKINIKLNINSVIISSLATLIMGVFINLDLIQSINIIFQIIISGFLYISMFFLLRFAFGIIMNK